MSNRNSGREHGYQDEIEAWASGRYDNGYGYQVFVEAFDEVDYQEAFGGCRTLRDALALAQSMAEDWTEQYEAAQAEIF